MINSAAVKALNFSPGQAAALALFAHAYSTKQDAIKKLLEKHEQKFTGNPNTDFMQLGQLSKERGRFFDDDLSGTFNNIPQMGKLNLGNIGSALQNAAQSVGTAVGQGLQVLAPVAGMAANVMMPGTGSLAAGLTSSLGGMLNPPKPQLQSALTEPVVQQLQTTFSTAQTNPVLDQRPPAQQLLNMLTTKTDPPATTEDDDKKILGMKKKTFYIVASIAGVAIVATIIIVIYYRNKKKKTAIPAKS